jgi:hypothetical protein
VPAFYFYAIDDDAVVVAFVFGHDNRLTIGIVVKDSINQWLWRSGDPCDVHWLQVRVIGEHKTSAELAMRAARKQGQLLIPPLLNCFVPLEVRHAISVIQPRTQRQSGRDPIFAILRLQSFTVVHVAFTLGSAESAGF